MESLEICFIRVIKRINTPINKWDYLGLKDIPFIKWAGGLTAGAGVMAKLEQFGLSSGLATALMFFPATCEVASFVVTSGSWTNYVQGKDPFDEDNFPELTVEDFKRFAFGLGGGANIGVELAYYQGNGIASADSFEGAFHTVEVSIPIVNSLGLSGYVGDKDDDGGFWWGGTANAVLGTGLGLSKKDWVYKHNGNKIDLDDLKGVKNLPGRCFCAELRRTIGGVTIWDAIKYF